MKGYTNKTEIENYLLINIDSSFDNQITRWIEDIEAYIDSMTGRNFIADEVAVQRRFDGSGISKLLTDDFIELEEIKLSKDDDALEIESDYEPYFLYPQNAQSLDRKVPYTRVELYDYIFPKGKQNIYLTAKWGYSEEVPSPIRFVATVLVAGIVNFSDNAEGEVQTMTIGRYSVTYKSKKEWQDFEQVGQILEQFKKYDI